MEYTVISEGYTTQYETETEAKNQFNWKLNNLVMQSDEVATEKSYFEDRENHWKNYKITVYLVNNEGEKFKTLEYIQKQK